MKDGENIQAEPRPGNSAFNAERPSEEAEQQLRPTTGVDGAAIAAAKAGLERKAKEVGKAVKELDAAAMQLQLEAIAGQPEFEAVMLEPVENIRKRYTGQHAQEIEIRRNACLYMLSRNCPVEDIAHILKMNLRTINALAGLNAETLAAFDQNYADWLNRGSARAFAHALAKLPESNALQAATVGGIMADKAKSIKDGVPQGGEELPVIELEDPALKSAREFLKLKSAKPVEDLTQRREGAEAAKVETV